MRNSCFTASLETNLQAEDMVVAPRGTTVYGRLVQASSAGRMSGSSQLTLELTDIVINGTAQPLLTSTFEVKGKGEGKKTTKGARRYRIGCDYWGYRRGRNRSSHWRVGRCCWWNSACRFQKG
jgi:hypothetical protein